MRQALGAALATPSSPGWLTELSICGIPNSSAARTTVAPAPSSKVSSAPTGAIITGRRSLGPNFCTVAQHARTKRDRVERHAVAPQRRLALSAADDVVPGVLVEVLARLAHDLVQ